MFRRTPLTHMPCPREGKVDLALKCCGLPCCAANGFGMAYSEARTTSFSSRQGAENGWRSDTPSARNKVTRRAGLAIIAQSLWSPPVSIANSDILTGLSHCKALFTAQLALSIAFSHSPLSGGVSETLAILRLLPCVGVLSLCGCVIFPLNLLLLHQRSRWAGFLILFAQNVSAHPLCALVARGSQPLSPLCHRDVLL